MKDIDVVVDIAFNVDISKCVSYSHPMYAKLQHNFVKAQSKEWIARRMEILMKYAVNSLRHQTNQDFTCAIRCTRATYSIIKEELKKYEKLPPNIRFAIIGIQPILKRHLINSKTVYHVVIDSDNMYSNDFIEKLRTFKVGKGTLTIMCQEGYIYNEVTDELAMIFHPSPSFYASIYTQENFDEIYPKRLCESHWQATKNYKSEYISGKNYLITVHEQNVDNSFEVIFKTFGGQMIEGKEKEAILRAWKIK